MTGVLLIDQNGDQWVPVMLVAALQLDAQLRSDGYSTYLAVRPTDEFPAPVHMLPLRMPKAHEAKPNFQR